MATQPRTGRQHDEPRGVLGREPGAALGPAGGEDGPAGPGAHAQPEAVGLRAAAVVRLEGALAHRRSLFAVVDRRTWPRWCGL